MKHKKLSGGLGLAAFLLGASAQASVLTFDGLGLAYYGDIPSTYGDNITSLNDGVGTYLQGNGFTPNITTSYGTRRISDGAVGSANLDFWPDSYGNLTNVAFPVERSGYYGEITLTPASGWNVVLNSFDLAGWPNLNFFNQPVQVLDALGVVLFDASGTVFGAMGTHSSYFPNISSTGALTIRYGDNWDVGIDNINFDQRLSASVPEPGSIALLGLGLLSLSYARRRMANRNSGS